MFTSVALFVSFHHGFSKKNLLDPFIFVFSHMFELLSFVEVFFSLPYFFIFLIPIRLCCTKYIVTYNFFKIIIIASTTYCLSFFLYLPVRLMKLCIFIQIFNFFKLPFHWTNVLFVFSFFL